MSLEVSALRALAHPLRLQILSLLTGTALSAAEVARELGTTQANASYHLRVLAEAGEVVTAGEEKIRGGVAKRYRHPWSSAAQTAQRSGATGPVEQSAFMRALTAELLRRNGFRHASSEGYVSDAEMWVTPAAWSEVSALVRQASELIHSSASPPRTPGTIHVNLVAVLFRMTDDLASSDPAADGTS
jgi:DNA-binding transcriptional ArsR family regulator